MPSVTTLSDFFAQAGITLRIYHLGRRVIPCSTAHFQAFEQQQVAWEAPFKNEARFALAFNEPTGGHEQGGIWCLALPLDEQGQLQPAARDEFLTRLLEAGLVSALTSPHANDHDPMKDNPLAYAPEMMPRAMLHAWLCHDHDLPLGSAAHQVACYIETPAAAPAWQQLSVQGIADWAVRMTLADKQLLSEQLPSLADEFIGTLCQCLEHLPNSYDPLAQALKERTQQRATLHDYGLRAVVGMSTPTATHWLDQQLTTAPSIEALAIISLRGWHHLEDAKRLPRFLEALAANEEVNLRESLHDLALIPRLRLPVIMALRQAAAGTALGRRLRALGLGHP